MTQDIPTVPGGEQAWACLVCRYEAEGYDSTIPCLLAQTAELIDALCAAVPEPHDGWYELMTACDNYANDICELDEGHAGPHVFPSVPVLVTERETGAA